MTAHDSDPHAAAHERILSAIAELKAEFGTFPQRLDALATELAHLRRRLEEELVVKTSALGRAQTTLEQMVDVLEARVNRLRTVVTEAIAIEGEAAAAAARKATP